MARRWNRQIVIASIQQTRQRGGKLNSNYIQKHRRKLYFAAYKWFGGWKQAVESAGIRYEEVRVDPSWRRQKRVWSESKILAAIKKRQNSGKPINSNFIQLHAQTLYQAALKQFGGWRQAVADAGFDYSAIRKVRPFRTWSKTTIALAIQERNRKGLSINYVVINREDSGLRSAAKRIFGKRGWAKALRFAGFNPRKLPDPRRIWSKEMVKAAILSHHRQGLPLNTASLRGELWKVHSAGRKLFGTWRNAIISARLSYAEIRLGKVNWWTRKRVVRQILRLERAGVRLSSKSIRLSRAGLFQAALKHFGSWSQTIDACGIDYRKHCRIWSTKAWVRKLNTTDVNRIRTRVRQLAK